MKQIMAIYRLGEMSGGFGETTGCPKVLVYFDTPLFSDRSEQIMKSFDVVIAEGGRFFLRYSTHW